ncbi:MAG: hypothetical protein RRZ38_00100 [Hafnia sp.]
MNQYLQAARFAMQAAMDASLPKGEREQWFETARQIKGEQLKRDKEARK